MRRIVGMLSVIAALSIGVAGAQATVVYEKGGNVYTASNLGKNSKLLVKGGREPALTPDGQTVIYSDKTRALYAVPVLGGTPVRLAGTDCSVCPAELAPDSKSIALSNSKGVLTRVPLDGGPATLLATGVDTHGTFSPDSTQLVFDSSTGAEGELFTVPAAGGVPTKLTFKPAFAPIWTSAGIVVTTLKVGSTVQWQLLLLDSTGNTLRVLTRKVIPNKGKPEESLPQVAVQEVGANLVILELGKGSRFSLKLIGLNHGTVKAQRSFSGIRTVQAISQDGKTILTVRKGKLQSVNFKTGKRTTLIKTGVESAYIN